MKRSEYGFFCPLTNDTAPTIYYNDTISSKGCIRQTIFHEIKHYINEDKEEDPEDDDLADYFGKYIACPIPYLIALHITTPNEIISMFGVSYQMACYVAKNVENRIIKYGYKLFDYEKPLLRHLNPTLFELYYEGDDVA